MRLPDNVERVDVRARGCERIIAPLGKTWDSFFLDVRASQTQTEREAF